MKGGYPKFAAACNQGAGLPSSRQEQLANCGTSWAHGSHRQDAAAELTGRAERVPKGLLQIWLDLLAILWPP